MHVAGVKIMNCDGVYGYQSHGLHAQFAVLTMTFRCPKKLLILFSLWGSVFKWLSVQMVSKNLLLLIGKKIRIFRSLFIFVIKLSKVWQRLNVFQSDSKTGMENQKTTTLCTYLSKLYSPIICQLQMSILPDFCYNCTVFN